MKKQKLLFIAILLLLGYVIGYGQNVVTDINAVKKPIEGKLYYQKKDKSLYLYRNGKFEIDNKFENDPVIVVPPVLPVNEQEIGYWDIPERILLTKYISGKYWLMQSDKNRTYYVARGINLFDDTNTFLQLRPTNIESEKSELGGLYKPKNFPENNFLNMGFEINQNGEYVKKGTIEQPKLPTSGDKIKIPVGVIRWDSWATDKANGSIVPGLRGAFSFPQTENYAPYYSTFTNPEYLDFTCYNQDNGFKPEIEKRLSTVKFDGDRPGIIEQDVNYARSAGIDFWAFNYYPDEATQSYARRQFADLPDKKGMKAAYITELVAMEDRIIDHFVWAIKQDWYQKVDNKPLIILAVWDKNKITEQINFLRAVEAKCNCKVYSSYQSQDWSSEKATVVYQNNLSACTSYGTWNGVPYGRKDHRYIIEDELKDWERSLDYNIMDLGLNVTISFTNAGVFASPINQRQSDAKWKFENQVANVATDDENREQLKNASNFIKAHPEKVKYMMIYSWNEHTEGQRTVCPAKLRNGTIDDSVLKIVGEYLE
ncbi:MAG TPA: hypothetical protein PKZ75_13055 [Bacteroidia bacterium]|nr:hypothetical protein [Bacteroidia bacterium]